MYVQEKKFTSLLVAYFQGMVFWHSWIMLIKPFWKCHTEKPLCLAGSSGLSLTQPPTDWHIQSGQP